MCNIPIVHLANINFNIIDISVENEQIQVLNHGKSGYFRENSQLNRQKFLQNWYSWRIVP
ncbi:hypothetical protein Barb6XT_02095 [Bacteroidales bacterium Barb6XT]|nr:hypothetical protein Barb6XT_02095 [Bacteroidales bacterium Barb6XT]